MIVRGRLTVRQLFYFLYMLMVPTIYFIPVGDLVRLAGRWGWWSPFVVAIPSAALALWLGARAARHGDLVSVARQALGPMWARLLFACLWVLLGIEVVFIFREVADQSVLSFTYSVVPLVFLLALTAVIGLYIALLGVVVAARLAAIFFFVVAVLSLVVEGSAVPSLHLVWMLPLLPRTTQFLGIDPLARISWWLSEPLLGVLLIHRLGPDSRRRAGTMMAAAILLGAAVMSVVTFVAIAFGGPQQQARVMLPGYVLLRQVRYSALLPTHLETVVNPALVITSALKVGMFLWLWARLGAAAWHLPRTWMLVGGTVAAAAAAWLALDPLRVEVGVFTVIGRFVVPLSVLLLVLGYALVRRPAPAT